MCNLDWLGLLDTDCSSASILKFVVMIALHSVKSYDGLMKTASSR